MIYRSLTRFIITLLFTITPWLMTGQSQAVTGLKPTQLVDLSAIAPAIQLDLRYATKNNFLNRAVYPQARCLLRVAAAQPLAKVQADLAKQGLGLKVFDCYRPLSVQKQMWAILPDSRYVANPANGSRHNRGMAVDVSLVDRTGKALEMPTEFDDFSDRARSDAPSGSAVARKHRQILAQAMQRQGFTPLATEWWHFDRSGWQNFGVLDVPFSAIPKTKAR
jgi:zinc D-Ala-D-Ala dipeptidase